MQWFILIIKHTQASLLPFSGTSLISYNNEKLIGLQKCIIPFLESLPNELCDSGRHLTLPDLSIFMKKWEKNNRTACWKEEMKYLYNKNSVGTLLEQTTIFKSKEPNLESNSNPNLSLPPINWLWALA